MCNKLLRSRLLDDTSGPTLRSGVLAMTEYRAYRFDGPSRMTSIEALEAKSDADAVNRVQLTMVTAVKCEIWCANRVVKRTEIPLKRPDSNRPRKNPAL